MLNHYIQWNYKAKFLWVSWLTAFSVVDPVYRITYLRCMFINIKVTVSSTVPLLEGRSSNTCVFFFPEGTIQPSCTFKSTLTKLLRAILSSRKHKQEDNGMNCIPRGGRRQSHCSCELCFRWLKYFITLDLRTCQQSAKLRVLMFELQINVNESVNL